VLGVVRDINERKQTEWALRESEERFRTMADTAPVLIWICGADKRYTYLNQQWLNFTGRSIDEELGERWVEGVHPADIKTVQQVFNRAFDLRHPFVQEYRHRRADGEYRWIYCSATPRFSPGEKFLGYIGSSIDITERKEAEQTLADLSGQLIRAREEECARIARELHDDLSQGMALVSVELEQLSQKPPNTDDELRRHLKAIFDQIGDISKEIHRISYDLHPSKLTQLGLVPTVTSLCNEVSKGRGLHVEFSHKDVPPALSNEVSLCLYRIVQESLNNVIKHSRAREARVELRGIEEAVQLRISDTGAGFDIESPQSKKGLGLMSMRERLRLVGGSISFESSPAQGTEIEVKIPLERNKHSANGHSSNGQKQKVP
jgi:PAS domain S-box-containing protein